MRFTTRNLCWLTITVAIAAALVRLFGIHAFGGVLIFGGFIFAPLLLALLSSLFQMVSVRARKRIAYVILVVLGGFPTLMATFAHPGFGMLAAFLIFGLWVMQIEIFNDLHKTSGGGARSTEGVSHRPTPHAR